MKNLFYIICIILGFLTLGLSCEAETVAIPVLSSSQTRADALQGVNHLNISFGGYTVDWSRTTQVDQEIPKPVSGKRSIDDIRKLIIGMKLEVYTFDPEAYIWMYVNCWGDNVSLTGSTAFKLEKTRDGGYEIPDYVRQVILDITSGPNLDLGGETISAKVSVKNEWGGYQDFWVPVYNGIAFINKELLDQEGFLVRTVRTDDGSLARFANIVTDLQTGEIVEAVHASSEIQEVGLKGWLKLDSLEMNVLIDIDWWGFGTIVNIETLPVTMTGSYTVKMRAEGVRYDRWGDEIEVSESPEFVTVRSIDTNDPDVIVYPSEDDTFQVQFKEGLRYQVIPGSWPTLRERPLPDVSGGKG